jgi:carboxylesterase
VPDPEVMPGAEPIDLPGGPVGVLLSHGFTGTTQSMRPWAEHLHAAGLSVLAPRLPGHGTSIKDMNRTGFPDWYGEVERAFDELRSRCETVFAMGLSMGGTLVLRLAQQRAAHVAGVVVVNASLATERKDAKLLPVLSKVLSSFPGIANDIKKPGVEEYGYSRTPLKAAHSMMLGWRTIVPDLGKITAPMLYLRSTEDHVVDESTQPIILDGVSGEVTMSRLENSYHVATLDNDAEQIFSESADFIAKVTSA